MLYNSGEKNTTKNGCNKYVPRGEFGFTPLGAF